VHYEVWHAEHILPSPGYLRWLGWHLEDYLATFPKAVENLDYPILSYKYEYRENGFYRFIIELIDERIVELYFIRQNAAYIGRDSLAPIIPESGRAITVAMFPGFWF